MGLFGKSKKDLNLTDKEVTLLCVNLHKAIEKYKSDVINGKQYDLQHFEKDVIWLVMTANNKDDIKLMHYVSNSCDAFHSINNKSPINEVAQIHFNLFCLSMELRKKYSGQKKVLEAISFIGLAYLQYIERLPIYKKVAQYVSENAKELGDTYDNWSNLY